VAFFTLRGAWDTEGCIRDGFKTSFGDFYAALFAMTISAVLDPLQCPSDLIEDFLLVP